jgi:hypothetical protein
MRARLPGNWPGVARRLPSGRAWMAGGPARRPAREGRQGCGLAAMGAVGIQIGSVDEGSQLGVGRGRGSLL